MSKEPKEPKNEPPKAELTVSDYQAMSIEQLTPIYKKACADWKRADAIVTATRMVLHAKQEIATAEKRAQDAKAKHATNAGKGGGL